MAINYENNATANVITFNAYVDEVNLVKTNINTNIFNDRTPEHYEGEGFAKIDFKNAGFLLRTEDGQLIKAEWANTAFGLAKMAYRNGEKVVSPKFKELDTLLSQVITKEQATADKPQNKVRFIGKIKLNEYYAVTKDKMYSIPQIEITHASVFRLNETDEVYGNYNGVILNKREESYERDGETITTGDWFITVGSFDYGNNIKPVTFRVKKDNPIVNNIDEIEKYMNVFVDYSYVVRHVGAKAKPQGTIGRFHMGNTRTIDTSTGYDVTEFVINSMDGVFNDEFPDKDDPTYEQAVVGNKLRPRDVVDEELEKRRIYLDNIKNKAIEKAIEKASGQTSNASTTAGAIDNMPVNIPNEF